MFEPNFKSQAIIVIHWLHLDVAAQRKLQDHTSGTACNPVKLLKWSRVGALGERGPNHWSKEILVCARVCVKAELTL